SDEKYDQQTDTCIPKCSSDEKYDQQTDTCIPIQNMDVKIRITTENSGSHVYRAGGDIDLVIGKKEKVQIEFLLPEQCKTITSNILSHDPDLHPFLKKPIHGDLSKDSLDENKFIYSLKSGNIEEALNYELDLEYCLNSNESDEK
ncbi:MAG TPA: hypothetical protein VFC05_03445, partial [Nitrososphaeraceae archaeon]|nr:hypothetical protein [Nitrososphaeraceae archaeon]